jgi:hypothetical protein
VKPIIQTASKGQIYELISFYGKEKFTKEQVQFFRRCVSCASSIWTGFVDGELVCIWGLIPPSLLSDQAYLWLYTTDALKGNEFMFVRQSQLAVETILKIYPVIIGHVLVDNPRAIRWLKWLGATFGEPDGRVLPFSIRRV